MRSRRRDSRPLLYQLSILGLVASLLLATAAAAVTGTKAYEIPLQGQPYAFAFTQDGAYLFSAGADRAVRQWRVATGELVRTLDGHGNMLWESRVTGLSISSDGALLASTGSDRTIRVWDVATGAHLRAIPVAMAAGDVEFVPGGATLVSVPEISTPAGDSVKVFDATTGARLRSLVNPKGRTLPPFRRGAVSPDGTRFAAFNSTAHWVVVWDLATGDTLFLRKLWQSREIYDVAFSPDGNRLAVAHFAGANSFSLHGTVSVLDAATGDSVRTMTAAPTGQNGGPVYSLAFAAGRILAASMEKVIRFPAVPQFTTSAVVVREWDIATGDSLRVIGGQNTSISYASSSNRPGYPGLAASPDGTLLASSYSTAFALWDLATGKRVRLAGGLAFPSGNVRLRGDGLEIILPSARGFVRLATMSGDTLGVMPGPLSAVSALSADDRYFAVPRTARIGELPAYVYEFLSSEGDLVTWNPYGAFVPTRAWVALHDAATGDSIAGYHVPMDSSYIERAWLSANGRRVIAQGGVHYRLYPSSPLYIRAAPAFFVWDRASGAFERTIWASVGESLLVRPDGATISPDGDHIAAFISKGFPLLPAVAVWNIARGDTVFVRRLEGSYASRAIAFSPDGARLAVDIGSPALAADLYDVATGNFLRRFDSSQIGYLNAISFSPDGSHLVLAASEGSDVEIFRCDTGARVGTLRAMNPLAPGFPTQNCDVVAALVTPDGRRVVVVTGQDLQVWTVDPPLTAAVLAVAPAAAPPAFILAQNAPNPFNPSTVIRFSLAAAGNARLDVYDVAGRGVRTLADGPRAAGMHEVVWDGRDARGRDVASGVYVYRLTAGRSVAVRRMVVAR